MKDTKDILKRTITYIPGKENKPRIENLIGKNSTIENSFFHEAYIKSFALIKSICELSKFESQTQQYDKNSNNIIAYIGERGSGKTSCMLSVYEALSSYNYTSNNGVLNEFLKDNSFYTLPVIDPAYFEQGNNILLIIIANMFKALKESMSNPNKEHYSNNFVSDKRDLVGQFHKVKESIDRISRNRSNQTIDSLEELASMSTTVNLKADIEELVRKYLKFMGGVTTLVVAIDDIDHEVEHAHLMIDQIRKYFIMPNVVILIAVKFEQLSDVMRLNYHKNYKELYNDEKSLSVELSSMSAKYLAKFIPYSHRIFLPVLNSSCKISFEGETQNSDKNEFIDQYILKLIFDKTGLMLYSSMEKTNYIIPYNLREFTNLISFLNSINSESDLEYKDSNLLQFKEYFTTTWCQEYLTSQQCTFIKKLYEQQPAQINKYTIEFLKSEYNNKEFNIDLEVINPKNRSYNISLGDVMYLIDRIETQNYRRDTLYFMFAIKTTYSILLQNTYYKLNSKSEHEARSAAFAYRFPSIKLLNQNSNHQSTNKMLKKTYRLEIYSDYERILGGGVMHISPIKGSNKELLHKRPINIKLLDIILDIVYDKVFATDLAVDGNTICNEVQNELLKNIKQNVDLYDPLDIERTKHYIVPFLNLYLYFTLTSSNSSTLSYYRVFRHCYYDVFFPNINIWEGKKNVMYDSLSIFYNVVKYRSLIKIINIADIEHLFKHDQSFCNVSDLRFAKFIRIMYLFRTELLIDVFASDKDKDSEYKSWFIQSTEFIELLYDYLPSLKQATTNPDTDRDNLMQLFTKIHQFSDISYQDSDNKKPFKKIEKLLDFLASLNKDGLVVQIFNNVFYENESL